MKKASMGMQNLMDVFNLKQTPNQADGSFISRAEWLIEKEVYINASPEAVFEVVADPASWPAWFPGIRSAYWKGEPGVGAERVVDMGMVQVTEKFYAYEPNKQFSFYLSETSVPMGDTWLEDMKFQAADGGTYITYKIAINPKPPLSWVGLLSKPVLESLFGESLKNLKAYIEG